MAGSGPLQLDGSVTLDGIRAQLLGSILFLDAADLAREWHRPLTDVHARVRDPHPALQARGTFTRV